uniref:Uncharacterized protein n=1 Tax=Oryza punctata TaxID=4537 RepID=A0A0E0L7Z1_ORYPU
MAAVLARPVLLRRVVVRRRVAVLLRRSRVRGGGGSEHEHGKRQRHQQPLQQSRHGNGYLKKNTEQPEVQNSSPLFI